MLRQHFWNKIFIVSRLSMVASAPQVYPDIIDTKAGYRPEFLCRRGHWRAEHARCQMLRSQASHRQPAQPSHGRQYFDGIDHYALAKIHRGHIKGTNIRFALQNMSNPLFCCLSRAPGAGSTGLSGFTRITPPQPVVRLRMPAARFSYFLRSFLEQSGIFFWVRRSFSRLWVPNRICTTAAPASGCEGFRGDFLRSHWHRRFISLVSAPRSPHRNNGWTVHHFFRSPSC